MANASFLTTYPGFLTGVLGAVCGALLTRALSRRREKIALVFELHKEFNTVEMSKHRKAAAVLVEEYPNHDLEQLSKESEDRSLSIILIMRFYQRLWLSIKYKQVKIKFVHELFSEVFYYWYYLSYQYSLKHLNWDVSYQIEDLITWFEQNDKKRRYVIEKEAMRRKRVEWLKKYRPTET